MTEDPVDQISRLWDRETPGLDHSGFEVVGRIHFLVRAFERREEQMTASHGLNRTDYALLCALRRVGSPYRLTPAQLAGVALVTSGAITKRLDSLEAKGLVERSASPSDRRSVHIVLTERGNELVLVMVKEDNANQNEMIARLSDDRRALLADLLRELMATIPAAYQVVPATPIRLASDAEPGAGKRSGDSVA